MTILGTKMSMVATCPMRRLARSEKTGTWEVSSDWQGCHTKILRGKKSCVLLQMIKVPL